MPLSVVLPAAALEASGFRVEIIDQRLERRWRRRVAEAVGDGCLYLGVSAMTGAQIAWGLRAAEIARRVAPSTPVVWGGIHPSMQPEETLSDGRVDAVVVGKGEEVAVAIGETLRRGDRAGVVGTVAESPARRRPAGCTLRQPAIAYERLPWRSYLTPVTEGTSGLAHATSRGCPHRCAYCYNRALNRSRWRGEPAEAVLDDLERLGRLGCTGVLLLEDNFFADRSRVESVARGLLARGVRLKVKADCRADYILRYDAAFLRLLKDSGFDVLFIGAESGSDRVLEMVRKDVTVPQILRANARLAKAGISPHYSFMAGLPGERESDVYATVRLMRRLKREHPGALLSAIKGYVPYPGTGTFDRAVEMGFEPPSSLEGWGRLDWNGGPRPWLSRRHALLVEKASYLTAGMDTQLARGSGLRRNPIMWWLYKFYSRVCRKKCERREFGPVPELPLLRLIKRWMSAA
jgi:radical SAM superfamily enzyme YgiQ (UPF0313 family)